MGVRGTAVGTPLRQRVHESPLVPSCTFHAAAWRVLFFSVFEFFGEPAIDHRQDWWHAPHDDGTMRALLCSRRFVDERAFMVYTRRNSSACACWWGHGLGGLRANNMSEGAVSRQNEPPH